ncbi:hypothetical protein LguiB_003519 [Lonicera macranthoides]
MTNRSFLSLVLLLFTIFLPAVAAHYNECVYTVYVQTGYFVHAGTDSRISLTLANSNGKSVWVPNLKDWGIMGSMHDYYERGNLDIFAGRGPCIDTPICKLSLTSDGSGAHPGWFCDYVELTATGPHKACSQTIFYVDQWLSTDVPPFELTAIVDGCKSVHVAPKQGNVGTPPFAVRNSNSSVSE